MILTKVTNIYEKNNYKDQKKILNSFEVVIKVSLFITSKFEDLSLGWNDTKFQNLRIRNWIRDALCDSKGKTLKYTYVKLFSKHCII